MPNLEQLARIISDTQRRQGGWDIQKSAHTNLDATHGVTVRVLPRLADLQALALALETLPYTWVLPLSAPCPCRQHRTVRH
jgi:hypothetical protein